MLFSIVIPTLNRATYLKSALASCLAQLANAEIIVSDNCSDDDTPTLVRGLCDSRIKYVRPTSRLPMSDNWEFALAHASGDYIGYIGDDDCLMPWAIPLATVAAAANPAAIIWNRIEYHWYDHPVPEYRGVAAIPLYDERGYVAMRRRLQRVFNLTDSYIGLPGVYHGFVHRDIISRARSMTLGRRYFLGDSPDVAAAAVNAAMISKAYRTGLPLSINAASGRSNGTLAVSNPQDETVRLFNSSLTDDQFFEPTGLTVSSVANTLLTTASRVPSLLSGYRIEPRRYLVAAFESLCTHPPSWKLRESVIPVLQRFADQQHLAPFFKRLLKQIPEKAPASPRQGHFDPHSGVLTLTIPRSESETCWQIAKALAPLIESASIPAPSRLLRISLRLASLVRNKMPTLPI